MNVAEKLREFDGRSVAPFEEVAEHLSSKPSAFRSLVRHAEKADREAGATWVIKDLLENGREPSNKITRAMLALAPRATTQTGRLHWLQILPYLNIEPAEESKLYRCLKKWTRSGNKFVRAWAYSGLGILARQNARYAKGVSKLFAEAAKTESAAVRARIRQVSKGLDRGPG